MNIREIAKRCDVSIGTVSHVLNGRPGVKKAARDKILQVVKEFNYDPADNVAAVQRVKKNVIKAVMPYGVAEIMTSPFYNKALEGLKLQASRDGSEVMIAHEHDFRKTIAESNGNYRLANAAGVLFICPQEDWRAEMERFIEAGVPIAVVNRPAPSADVISVLDRRDEGIGKLMTHLAGHGYRKIACFNTSGIRLNTVAIVRQWAEELGMAVVNETSASHGWQNLLGQLEDMHRHKNIPDAIVAFDDLMALRVIQYLQRWGYRVPEDVPVTGYDNIRMGTFVYPELTTVDCPVDKMTAFAAKRLLEKINDPDVPGTETFFRGELIIRESCGCGKSG